MNFHLSKEYRYHTKNRKEKKTIDTLIQNKGKKSQKREYKVVNPYALLMGHQIKVVANGT